MKRKVLSLLRVNSVEKENIMAHKNTKNHTIARMKARNAGQLRRCRAGAWDRRVSKKERSRRRCRKVDPHKGGARY